jgi:GNAT superfamily N-acetyltransferase
MHKRRSVYQFVTDSGLKVMVYRIKPEDTENLVDLFKHLSETSRYQRFNEVLTNPDPKLVWQTAQHMALVTPKQGMAWLAFADLPGEPHAPVAGARYILLADRHKAEVSVAVRDDLQRQGIGADLMRYLAHYAHTHGVKQLTATFDTSNKAIWRLMHQAPYGILTKVHGPETEIVIDLTKPVEPEPTETNKGAPVQPDPSELAKEQAMPEEVITKFFVANGLELRVRPQTAADSARMVELFDHGSPQKRLARMRPVLGNTGQEALAEAVQIMPFSQHDGCAWLGFADLPGRPDSLVASGRFMVCSPDEAEMSIVVRDDMQGQGIGSKMLYFVLDQARAMGVHRMTSCFGSDNEAVWQILSYSPYHVTWQPRGKQVEVTVHLQARTEGSPSLN